MKQSSLAETLRVLRARQDLTITEASSRIGITRETLRDLEHGTRNPYYPTLQKIAKAYGVMVEELMLPAHEEESMEEPALAVPLADAPEEAGLTDEEIRRIEAGLLTPGATSEADMKKLLQYENGNIVISALEDMCDHAEHVLKNNRFTLDDIESLEGFVSGQYYSHKYDPRREDVLQRGTPQQKADLKREEARTDEVLSALHKAYLERLEREQLQAKSDPAKLARIDDRHQAHEAKRRNRAETLRRMEDLEGTGA
jgi:transcriptional regulator with XRE-family HTH domain